MRVRLNQIIAIYLIFALAGITSCKVNRKITGKEGNYRMEKEIIQKAIKNQKESKFVEMKVSGKAKTGDQSINFQGTIRLIRDETIWISLRSQIGIEIARVLATPDSVWIISKLLRIKEKGNWGIFEAYTGYHANFIVLQGILNQNLFNGNSSDKLVLINELIAKSANDQTWIYSRDPESEELAGKGGAFRFLIDPVNNLVKKTEILDDSGRMVASVDYAFRDDAKIKRIEMRGSGDLNEYSLDLNIHECEVKESVDIRFERW